MLLLGLGIGVAAVFLGQMLRERGYGWHNVSALIHGNNKGVEKTEPAESPARKDTATKPARPKFDFYTILPETETVLPEKGAPKIRPPPPAAAKPPAEEGVSYVLQAGSFATFQEADQLKARLALAGLTAHIQKVTIEGRGEYHRVRVGPFGKLDELDATSQQLQRMGFKPIRLKVKKEAG